VSMKLNQSVNLVLFDNKNVTVWTSNDHPGDSWPIGQTLREGQSLTANLSATNLTKGLSFVQGGLAAYTGSDPPQLYYQLRSDNDEIQNKSTDTTFRNGSIDIFASSNEISHLSLSLSLAPTMQF